MATLLTLRCVYCDAEIMLSEDSQAARVAGTDPRQQMRRHIFAGHSPDQIADHERKIAWLIDMLFFRCPSDPQRWRGNIDAMVTHLLSES